MSVCMYGSRSMYVDVFTVLVDVILPCILASLVSSVGREIRGSKPRIAHYLCHSSEYVSNINTLYIRPTRI